MIYARLLACWKAPQLELSRGPACKLSSLIRGSGRMISAMELGELRKELDVDRYACTMQSLNVGLG